MLFRRLCAGFALHFSVGNMPINKRLLFDGTFIGPRSNNWNNIDVWIKRIMYLTIMMINNISETILFVVFCIATKKCSYIVYGVL